MASACSCPSYVQAKLAGLGKPMAFASPAYVYAFVAMLKVLPVAPASQACSSEARMKAARRATAKESPFACRAYAYAFAETKAVVRRIVWQTAERACSFPASCPSDFDLQFVLCSAWMPPLADASPTFSFRASSSQTYYSCRVFLWFDSFLSPLSTS